MAREFAKAFYKSAAWKKTREYIFNKYHGLCVDCGNPGEDLQKHFIKVQHGRKQENIYLISIMDYVLIVVILEKKYIIKNF